MTNAILESVGDAHVPTALELYLKSVAPEVKPAKAGKTVVAKMADDEVRKWAPFLIDGVVNPTTQLPWVWTDPDGVNHVGMMRTVKESDVADPKRRFGPLGSVYVVYPLVTVTAELARFNLDEYGKGNRKQQKTTLDEYVEAMKSGNWSYVGNSEIHTTTADSGNVMQYCRLADDSMHNLGHTGTALTLTGCTILVDFKFGIPKEFVGRIDNNRKRDQKSVIETLKPFAHRLGQVGKIEGYPTSTVFTATHVGQMEKVFTDTLAIVCKVREGDAPKTGGKQADNETTYTEGDAYREVLCRAVEDVYLLAGKDKTFALHHLAAAMVLAVCDETEEGIIVWNDARARQVIERYSEARNPDLTDLSMPMVALRETFKAWSTAKKNNNGSGFNIRWNCLKLALLRAQHGQILPMATFDGIKATDHSKSMLRLGGIDDYVSAIDAVPAQAEPSSVPAPLFGTAEPEEMIDG